MSPYVRLSVIIPVYNGESFILNSFSKLADLLYIEDEIIFIDNNSTDNSVDEIRKLSVNTNIPIKLFHEKKQGSGPARTHGIQQARGEYIVFIDVDDEVTSRHINQHIQFLKKNREYNFVYARTLRVDNNNIIPIDKLNHTSEIINSKLAIDIITHFGNAPHLCTYIFRRQFLIENAIVFSEDLRIGQDIFFQLCVLLSCEKSYYLHDVVFKYKKHAKSTTRIFGQNGKTAYNFYLFYKYCLANIYTLKINDKRVLEDVLNQIQIGIMYNYKIHLSNLNQKPMDKTNLFSYMLNEIYSAKINFREKVIIFLYFLKRNKVLNHLFNKAVINKRVSKSL